jgi:hypothetical protein
MKTQLTTLILGCALALNGCQCNESRSPQDDMEPQKNAYKSPEEALKQTQEHLHLLLNENQRKVFGLSSDEEIQQLTTTLAVPISYLQLERLGDTARLQTDDGYWYGLGSGDAAKIGISVERAGDVWIQSTIGMKKFVQATNRHSGVTRLVEVPGLEMSFVELSENQRVSYAPIADYGDAKLSADSRYSWPELLRILDGYRVQLEREFGDDFTKGNLER